MRTFWRNNNLSLVLTVLFLGCLLGQVLFGRAAYNDELVRDGAMPLGYIDYLQSGHFLSALAENWESEFLQMGMYVILTVHLRQRGSAESRPLDPSKEDNRIERGPVPWPVRRGGIWRSVYDWSLSLAMGALFLSAFIGHSIGSWRLENAERALDGRLPEAWWDHVTGAQFWFESMQNWQSEFLAVFSLVVLTIVLRQKDSPQSKPVRAPHAQTGG